MEQASVGFLFLRKDSWPPTHNMAFNTNESFHAHYAMCVCVSQKEATMGLSPDEVGFQKPHTNV